MRAYKFEIDVGPDRTVRIQLPEGIRQGRAEVIVLADEADEGTVVAAESVDAFFDDAEQNPLSRPREQLDRDLAAERDCWD